MDLWAPTYNWCQYEAHLVAHHFLHHLRKFPLLAPKILPMFILFEGACHDVKLEQVWCCECFYRCFPVFLCFARGRNCWSWQCAGDDHSGQGWWRWRMGVCWRMFLFLATKRVVACWQLGIFNLFEVIFLVSTVVKPQSHFLYISEIGVHP